MTYSVKTAATQTLKCFDLPLTWLQTEVELLVMSWEVGPGRNSLLSALCNRRETVCNGKDPNAPAWSWSHEHGTAALHLPFKPARASRLSVKMSIRCAHAQRHKCQVSPATNHVHAIDLRTNPFSSSANISVMVLAEG